MGQMVVRQSQSLAPPAVPKELRAPLALPARLMELIKQLAGTAGDEISEVHVYGAHKVTDTTARVRHLVPGSPMEQDAFRQRTETYLQAMQEVEDQASRQILEVLAAAPTQVDVRTTIEKARDRLLRK